MGAVGGRAVLGRVATLIQALGGGGVASTTDTRGYVGSMREARGRAPVGRAGTVTPTLVLGLDSDLDVLRCARRIDHERQRRRPALGPDDVHRREHLPPGRRLQPRETVGHLCGGAGGKAHRPGERPADAAIDLHGLASGVDVGAQDAQSGGQAVERLGVPLRRIGWLSHVETSLNDLQRAGEGVGPSRAPGHAHTRRCILLTCGLAAHHPGQGLLDAGWLW